MRFRWSNEQQLFSLVKYLFNGKINFINKNWVFTLQKLLFDLQELRPNWEFFRLIVLINFEYPEKMKPITKIWYPTPHELKTHWTEIVYQNREHIWTFHKVDFLDGEISIANSVKRAQTTADPPKKTLEFCVQSWQTVLLDHKRDVNLLSKMYIHATWKIYA